MNYSFPTFRNRKVLVTGGAGLIGSAFVERLLQEGAQVSTVRHERPIPFPEVAAMDGDLLDPRTCDAACLGMDTVIHAAGVSGGSKQVALKLIPMFTDNLRMNTQILESARQAGVERYLFISNSSVYGDSAAPLKEEDAWGPTCSTVPENETGVVKRTGETQCAVYAKFTAMRIAVIRAGNAYGPRDNFDTETSHVLPALIHKAVRGDNPYRIWGAGGAVRDFVHSRDIALSGLYMLERAQMKDCFPVNIATGRTVNILEAARLILDMAGHATAAIEMVSSAPAASAAKRIDVTRMRALGFQPQTSLEQGLAETIAWFRSAQAT